MADTNITTKKAIDAIVQFIKQITPNTVRVSQINRVPAGKGDRVFVTLLRETPMNYVVESYSLNDTNYTTNINLTVQVDCYSIDNGIKPLGYWDAQTTARNISRMVRTNFAANFFDSVGFEISPINASHVKNMSFVNHSGEYEQRHMFELTVNYNPSVIINQDFFTEATVTTKLPADLLEE